MPELPEVEHLRRTLVPHLLGRVVRSVRILRRDIVVAPGDPPGGISRSRRSCRPQRLGPPALLVGARIDSLERLGKQLALVAADGRVACIHLGMSGQLRWRAAPESPLPHEHVIWRLDDGSSLAFRDPRRFGGVWVFPSRTALLEVRWAGLGPDALSIGSAALRSALGRSARPVKAALLDQSAIAGVGNIYADEALYAAGISPQRPANAVSGDEARRLAGAIRRILNRSIASGGSTLRDYRDGEGKPGSNQHRLAAYGREGERCPRCGSTFLGLRIAQRATVMCPRCQP